MKTKKIAQQPEKIRGEISEKLDVIIKLLAVIATEKDFQSCTQSQQILYMNKIRLRNKDISNIFGIKPQQVNNALLKAKKSTKKK